MNHEAILREARDRGDFIASESQFSLSRGNTYMQGNPGLDWTCTTSLCMQADGGGHYFVVSQGISSNPHGPLGLAVKSV